MELLFLGSGAGELWPSAFCGCDSCRQARHGHGEQARIGSCLLIDRRYLIDVPPNLGLAAAQRGVSLAEVTHVFVTHSHQDHFDPCVLAATGRPTGGPLKVYVTQRLADLLPLYQQFNRFFDPRKLNLEVSALRPLDQVREEEAGLVVTALLADHDTTGGEEPLIFILEHGGKTVLYACDTGWFPDRTWQEIERRRYDAVVLECTCREIRESRRGHLSLGPFLEVKARLQSSGLLNPGAAFIAQHILHKHGTDRPSDQALRERLAGEGVLLAEDGMVVRV